jgi:hypothetical protein
MKVLIPLAMAAFLIPGAASAEAMGQGTKDRISAYVRVSIGWMANEACMFVMGDERESFLDQIAYNVIGLGRELDSFVSSHETSNAFLKMLQGQAFRQVQANYSDCGDDAETAVRNGILEATAINESITAKGPYVDPRAEVED